jgi:hypothetical protein
VILHVFDWQLIAVSQLLKCLCLPALLRLFLDHFIHHQLLSCWCPKCLASVLQETFHRFFSKMLDSALRMLFCSFLHSSSTCEVFSFSMHLGFVDTIPLVVCSRMSNIANAFPLPFQLCPF